MRDKYEALIADMSAADKGRTEDERQERQSLGNKQIKSIIEAAAITAKAMAGLAEITHLKNEAATNHDVASSSIS